MFPLPSGEKEDMPKIRQEELPGASARMRSLLGFWTTQSETGA